MMKIGIVGVGDISGIYLKNITETFRGLKIVALCDLVKEKALRASEKYGIKKVYDDMHGLFADPEVELILNLTRPHEHYEVSRAALLAGRHVYCEKPLGANLEEGLALVALAKEKGLFLGGAPDTFLGAGIQTCRKLIDSGLIGAPVGAAAFMVCRGHESWHPDPEFYYKRGGGPMMDMGPYYITALINLLGGVRRVCGMGRASFPERLITSAPLSGTKIDVDVPTYTAGLLEFASGAIGTIFTTFDVVYNDSARLEVYGSEGTLFVPDPNGFGGPVKLLARRDGETRELPLLFDYADNSRALGLADMAAAIEKGRPGRAMSNQTLHVLEIMDSIEKSGRTGEFIGIQSRYERSAPMRPAELKGVLD